MEKVSGDHEHDDAAPVTDRIHDNSWSANLEKPMHAGNPELVIKQAIEAIRHTTDGNHVNLVTHSDLGHPSEYLYPKLSELPLDRPIDWEYIEQCGCGGHVTRVYIQ